MRPCRRRRSTARVAFLSACEYADMGSIGRTRGLLQTPAPTRSPFPHCRRAPRGYESAPWQPLSATGQAACGPSRGQLADRLRGCVVAELIDLAVDEPAASRGDDRSQFLDQNRLADARRASHQDAAAIAIAIPLGGGLEGTSYCLELWAAPDQPWGCQLAREVALAQRKRPVLPACQCRAEPRQIMGRALGALIAAVRLLLQQAHDDIRQSDRYGRIDRNENGRHCRRWSRMI